MTQGDEAWRLSRIGKVTASKISAVVSKGRGNEPSATRAKYMGQLIAETLTGTPSETFTNGAMEWGTTQEPLARARYELVMMELVEQVDLIDHPHIARAAASPDGLVGDKGLVELKAPETHTHIEYLTANAAPSIYQPQMAWQLACTEREWCDFVSFDPRMPPELQLFVVRYVPPAGYIATLERAVREFLREMDAKIADLKGLRAPQDITQVITAPPASTPRVVTINPNIF